MTDVIGRPSHDESGPQLSVWERDWINEHDGEYKDMRLLGLDVLHRIEKGLPLSDRESAVAQQYHDELEAQKKQYMEALGDPVYGDDNDTAKLLVEQIGTQLQHPTDQLAALSDERPTDQTEAS